MPPGKKQLVLAGVAAGLFMCVTLTGIAVNVGRGNYIAIPLVLLALVLAILSIWLGIWLNRRRIQMMFRHPTPDRLIEHYHATLLQARARRIPDAEAAAACPSALAAAVYGQFDRAREELAAVDWEKSPVMYRVHRLDLLALIALLEKKDSATAMRLAKEAEDLARTEALAQSGRPGGLPILHHAILVAAGDSGVESVERTQRAVGKNTGAIPALCAWAMSLYFDRSGQAAEAARYRSRAKEAAPHFVGSGSP